MGKDHELPPRNLTSQLISRAMSNPNSTARLATTRSSTITRRWRCRCRFRQFPVIFGCLFIFISVIAPLVFLAATQSGRLFFKTSKFYSIRHGYVSPLIYITKRFIFWGGGWTRLWRSAKIQQQLCCKLSLFLSLSLSHTHTHTHTHTSLPPSLSLSFIETRFTSSPLTHFTSFALRSLLISF